MKQLRREGSQSSSLPIQQFREGMTIEHRVAIINKEAKAMMSTGNFYGAIECCNEAINLNNSPLAVINRAYCYKHLKNWKLAIEDFTLALQQDPLHPAPILAQRGICYGKIELYEQALSDLNSAIELDQSNYNCFNRGCILADAGEYESAIIDFNRIISSKDPSDLKSRSIYHRAGTYVKLKRYESAIEDLRGLLRADPNSLYPRMLLGKALKMIGDLPNAEESVSRGIDLDTKLADSYIERGDIRCRMGTKKKIDEAITDFQTALLILKKESADTSNGANRLSVINMVNNSHNQSFQLLNPDDNENQGNRQISRPTTGNHLRIVRTLSQLSHNSDEHHSVHSTPKHSHPQRTLSGFKTTSSHILGRKHKLNKSHSRSDGDKDKNMKIVPFFGNQKIASVLIKLAQARLLISDDVLEHSEYHHTALRDAELAIQIFPSDINFSLVCVVCYIRLAQYDQAASLLDSLLQDSPSHKKILYHRAFCYRAVNNTLKAVECLTKIISETTGTLLEGKEQEEEEEMDFLERVYEMRGTLLHEQKAYKIAVVDFGKAIALRPNRPENYYFRGSCHSKLGNFERAISDFTIAEAIGFQNIPFLLMEKGCVLRIMGRSEEGAEIFTRAMERFPFHHDIELLQKVFTSNPKQFLLYFRLSMYYALCLLDLKNYEEAELSLFNLTELFDNHLGQNTNDFDENSSKDYSVCLTIDTSVGSSIIPFDGHLQWILKYHLSMCSYMQQDYVRSQELLSECVTLLRPFAPDGFSLGSALYYHAISEYFNISSYTISDDVIISLNHCIELLTECLSSPWTEISVKKRILCYLCRGKTFQRLQKYEESISDLTECIRLYEESNSNKIISSDSAYAYFRRAWSYKALQQYDLAANDFETAKLLKSDNPNFSINYRSINHVEYIEIETEPDLTEPFAPLIPLYAQLSTDL